MDEGECWGSLHAYGLDRDPKTNRQLLEEILEAYKTSIKDSMGGREIAIRP